MDEKKKELEFLAKPLNDWLQENYSPHHSIIIEFDNARVVGDEIGVILETEN